MGPALLDLPGFLLLSSKIHMAQDGRWFDETFQKGDNCKVKIPVQNTSCVNFISVEVVTTVSILLMTSHISRFIEDQDEKREKLVQFFCRNIHNK